MNHFSHLIKIPRCDLFLLRCPATMARRALGLPSVVLAVKQWQGPFSALYSDDDCPNLGCSGSYGTVGCESWCERTSGCNGFNGATSPTDLGCCLRGCSDDKVQNPSMAASTGLSSYRLIGSSPSPSPSPGTGRCEGQYPAWGAPSACLCTEAGGCYYH